MAGSDRSMAAEDRGPLVHAHVGMMLALHGAPEYDEFIAKRAQEAARPKTEQQQPK